MAAIFSQRDPQWFDRPLGDSGLVCGHFGCLITDIAQALTLAGYPDCNPGNVFDALNAIGGFTNVHYEESAPGKGDGQAGLLYWGKLTQAYPQIHFGNGAYHLVQGTWGRFNHWILKEDGGWVSDPFYGVTGEPAGFKETSEVRSMSIDPYQAPAPVPEPAPAPAPSERHNFTINLIPDGEWSKKGLDADKFQNRGEVSALQDTLIRLGFIAGDSIDAVNANRGYFGPRTINAVVAFQVAKGIVPAGSSYPGTYAAGWFGPRTRDALNNA